MPAHSTTAPAFANLASRPKDLAFGHWLAGFVAGEGCFILYTGTSKGYVCCQARFALHLRDDDSPILEETMDFLGCGRLYRRTHRKGNEKPVCMFQVDNISDLYLRLVSLFDQCPLRAKKARDYAIWRQAVKLLYEVRQRPNQGNGRRGYWSRRTEADLAEFKRLQTELIATRAYVETPDGNGPD